MFISETVYPKTCNQLKADSHQKGFQTLQQRFKSVDLVAFSNRSLQWLWCEQPMSIDVALPKPPKPVGIVVPLRWEDMQLGRKTPGQLGSLEGFLKDPPDGFEDGSLIHSTWKFFLHMLFEIVWMKESESHCRSVLFWSGGPFICLSTADKKRTWRIILW